ncbi:hypothetical protein fugu_012867 [Takifugu bimaculatus]|uniref:Uncharacterized protein n=1 Tax=Takifugu bimaculatus TaxID=433685 RepID=A0A4Z2C6K4_9TELE|nr:hypothetical protein fugu_012867 [Takifugu bimaculatus]
MYITGLQQPLFIVVNVRKVSRASHLFWEANSAHPSEAFLCTIVHSRQHATNNVNTTDGLTYITTSEVLNNGRLTSAFFSFWPLKQLHPLCLSLLSQESSITDTGTAPQRRNYTSPLSKYALKGVHTMVIRRIFRCRLNSQNMRNSTGKMEYLK